MEHFAVHSLQLPHFSDLRFMGLSLVLDTSANRAPRGHRYLQKNRSMKREPMIISSRNAPPRVRKYSRLLHALREEYIPNTVHGLQITSPVTEKPQTPIATNASTTYFSSLRYLSAFSGIFTLNGISLPTAFRRSCIAPNEQINPQK